MVQEPEIKTDPDLEVDKGHRAKWLDWCRTKKALAGSKTKSEVDFTSRWIAECRARQSKVYADLAGISGTIVPAHQDSLRSGTEQGPLGVVNLGHEYRIAGYRGPLSEIPAPVLEGRAQAVCGSTETSWAELAGTAGMASWYLFRISVRGWMKWHYNRICNWFRAHHSKETKK